MTQTCPAMLAAKRGVNWGGRHASIASKLDSVTVQNRNAATRSIEQQEVERVRNVAIRDNQGGSCHQAG